MIYILVFKIARMDFWNSARSLIGQNRCGQKVQLVHV